jgi:osmoprotectant transport system substrate-binding protein
VPIVDTYRWVLVLGAGLLVLAGCGAADDDAAPRTALGDDTITVGSFDFPESVLLAEIYSQALEGGGFSVERAFALGPREFVGPALATGLIELVPEYAGSALTFTSRGSATPSADPAAAHRALERTLAGTNVAALAPAPAQNANTFAVTRETARRHDLHRLSDLRAFTADLRFGGPAECPSRPFCLLGLRERYGLEFAGFLTLQNGLVTAQALDDGDVDVALMFTTDPALADYVELDDDRGLQPAESVTPLIRTEVIERWGADVARAIDAVSRELGTATLRELNALDAEEPGTGDVAAIATDWLQTEVPS